MPGTPGISLTGRPWRARLLACSKVHGPKGPERGSIMPVGRRKRPRAPAKGSIRAARQAVVDAKASATGRAFSRLHRAESILALAEGVRRADTHASKKKKKTKKRGKKS
jgi:hypothetical protein